MLLQLRKPLHFVHNITDYRTMSHEIGKNTTISFLNCIKAFSVYTSILKETLYTLLFIVFIGTYVEVDWFDNAAESSAGYPTSNSNGKYVLFLSRNNQEPNKKCYFQHEKMNKIVAVKIYQSFKLPITVLMHLNATWSKYK